MAEGLTKHQLEIIVDAVLKSKKKINKEKQKEKQDWKLRNTNLLLKNYRMLKKHCDGIVPRLHQFEESIFDPEELNLEKLMKYKAQTKEMFDYFDIVLSSYNQYCHNQDITAERRFDVINKIYISNPSFSKSQMAGIYYLELIVLKIYLMYFSCLEYVIYTVVL